MYHVVTKKQRKRTAKISISELRLSESKRMQVAKCAGIGSQLPCDFQSPVVLNQTILTGQAKTLPTDMTQRCMVLWAVPYSFTLTVMIRKVHVSILRKQVHEYPNICETSAPMILSHFSRC